MDSVFIVINRFLKISIENNKTTKILLKVEMEIIR